MPFDIASRVYLFGSTSRISCGKQQSMMSGTMADQENKDFSEDIADQSFDQNGEAENGGSGAGDGDATENGQESQEDR